MKVFLTLFVALLLALPSCTNLDDLYRRLDDYESRLAKVEKLTDAANREIAVMKGLLDAQQKKILIDAVNVLEDGSGYQLVMSNGSVITLKNGKDGESANIDVRRGEDGVLYWTINGQYMHDADGNKIKAQGMDGKSGVTPQLRVNKDNYWEYSFDGVNWLPIKDENHQSVKATDSGSAASDLVIDDTSKQGYIIITYKGKRYEIPTSGQYVPSKPDDNTPKDEDAKITITSTAVEIHIDEAYQIEYKLTPSTASKDDVKWTSSNPSIAEVSKEGIVTGKSVGTCTISAQIGSTQAQLEVTVIAKEAPMTIELSVGNITAVSADIASKPSDETKMCRTNVVTKEQWEQSGGVGGIFENWDQKYWKGLATNYEGSNWTEFIQYDSHLGERSFTMKELGMREIGPQQDYVAYSYGINPQTGELLTEIYFKEFKTNSEVQKGLTFQVTITDVTASEVLANIVPSDKNLEYRVYVESESFVNSRADKKAMAYYLAQSGTNPNWGYPRTGDTELTPEDYSPRRSKRGYYIIVFGFDADGVTSEVSLTHFTTK